MAAVTLSASWFGMEPRTPDVAAELSALRGGMRAQEFVLYYQPVVSLPHGQIVAHEALARWQSPKGGAVARCLPAGRGELGTDYPVGIPVDGDGV